MSEPERDPIFRWVGEHQGWAFVLTILFVLCIFATIGGFAFIAFDGGLAPAPSASATR